MSLQNEDVHNLAYTVVQVVHNFGTVIVMGGYITTLIFRADEIRLKTAWVSLAGWAIQGISGASFGAVSYYFYHQFPDIGLIGKSALALKIFCVGAGFALTGIYILNEKKWSQKIKDLEWFTAAALAATALTAAAILRWFS
jgi:hypothetical protein